MQRLTNAPGSFPRGTDTGELPPEARLGSTPLPAALEPSDARITGYSPTPVESSSAVTPMNYSTLYLLATA